MGPDVSQRDDREGQVKILLYGSAFLSSVAERALLDAGFDVVGHVPCQSPSFPGKMLTPATDEWSDADVRLSVLYDRRIHSYDRSFNIHPGLLPRWAGCDIFYHTVMERPDAQGWTFHRVVYEFDRGPIVSSVSYPVFERDRIVDVFERAALVLPGFTVSCARLLESGVRDGTPCPDVTYYPRSLPKTEIYREAADDIRGAIRAFQH